MADDTNDFMDAMLCAGGALVLLAPPAVQFGLFGFFGGGANQRDFTGKAKAKADEGPKQRAKVEAAFRLAKARLLAASRSCVQYVLHQLYQGATGADDDPALRQRVQARLDALRPDVRRDVDAFVADPALKGLTDAASRREALFPGAGMLSKTSGLNEFDATDSKIVARNWNKGKGILHKAGYEVCLQSKTAHELNQVEMVVAVLLHEVAHTIHREQEYNDAHGPDFDAINNFLVGLARCELGRASPTEKRTWRSPDTTDSRWMAITDADNLDGPGLREFDVGSFSAACTQGGSKNASDWPQFCGIKAPIGACGRCGRKPAK